MTSQQKIGLAHIDSEQNILINNNKIKSLSRQHRHYHSSKMLKTNILNETNSINFVEKNGGSDVAESTFQKKEMRKYCINKFRVMKDQEKPLVKRKNITLNLFKRDDIQKLKVISKTQKVQSIEALPQLALSKDEKTINNLFKQLQSLRSITPKLRFQIKASKVFKMKTQTTQENQQKINDISFQQTYKKQKNFLEQQKQPKNQQIKTEEALNKLLRKASLTKKKVLIKNPFERYERLKKGLILSQYKNEDVPQMDEFNQSQIHNCDNSIRSIAHHQQLKEIIAMI